MLFPGAAETSFTFDGTTSGTITSMFVLGAMNDLRLVVNNTGNGFTGVTSSFVSGSDATEADMTASLTYTTSARLSARGDNPGGHGHHDRATPNASVNPRGCTSVTFVYGTDPNLTTGTTTSSCESIGSGTRSWP